jgi:predicted Abi (CAAX) family protease
MRSFITHTLCQVRLEARKMRWESHSIKVLGRNEYRILARKTEWKRSVGNLRHGWANEIKMNLRGIG